MKHMTRALGKVILEKEEGFVGCTPNGKPHYYCHNRDVATGKYDCNYATTIENTICCCHQCEYNKMPHHEDCDCFDCHPESYLSRKEIDAIENGTEYPF